MDYTPKEGLAFFARQKISSKWKIFDTQHWIMWTTHNKGKPKDESMRGERQSKDKISSTYWISFIPFDYQRQGLHMRYWGACVREVIDWYFLLSLRRCLSLQNRRVKASLLKWMIVARVGAYKELSCWQRSEDLRSILELWFSKNSYKLRYS